MNKNTYVTEVFDRFNFSYRLIECQAKNENEARDIVKDNMNEVFDVIYRIVKIKDGEKNSWTNIKTINIQILVVFNMCLTTHKKYKLGRNG